MALGYALLGAFVAYLLLLFLVLYIFVFADPEQSPTARFFTVELPGRTCHFLYRLLGQRNIEVLNWIGDRTLILIYCVVVFGAWSVIFAYVYPWVNEQTYVSHYHKYVGYAVFGACVLSWRYASTSSPGLITAKNRHFYDHFPYDNLMFVPDQTCSTCEFPKLARSKHDRYKYKRHCVARFDHFCGEENYRFFLLFLLVHVGMCLYGTVILSMLFHGEILEQELLEVTFFNRYTGEELKADKWILFQFMFHRHLYEMGAWLLMGAMCIALTIFLGYHIWLTSRGLTTNESFKWAQVKQWHRRELKRYQQAIKDGQAVPKEVPSRAVVSDGDVTCTKGPGREPEEPEDAIYNPGPPPVNIYDRGLVENWKEVLFPLSLRKLKARRAARAKAKGSE